MADYTGNAVKFKLGTQENLNTLKSGNKKINELEKKILSYRKKLKSKNIM